MYEIAIYGGAFNPPHAGHASVMVEAAKQAKQVMVVPSYKHPFGKVMVDFDVRVSWLEQIAKQVRRGSDAPIDVSRIESDLFEVTGKPVFSFSLLTHIAANRGIDGKKIALVVGPDVAELLPTFYLGPQLLDRFSLITIEEQSDVRSTAIRRRLEQGDELPLRWMAPGMNQVDYEIYAASGV